MPLGKFYQKNTAPNLSNKRKSANVQNLESKESNEHSSDKK